MKGWVDCHTDTEGLFYECELETESHMKTLLCLIFLECKFFLGIKQKGKLEKTIGKPVTRLFLFLEVV